MCESATYQKMHTGIEQELAPQSVTPGCAGVAARPRESTPQAKKVGKWKKAARVRLRAGSTCVYGGEKRGKVICRIPAPNRALVGFKNTADKCGSDAKGSKHSGDWRR